MSQQYVMIIDGRVLVCKQHDKEHELQLDIVKQKSGKVIRRILDKVTSLQYNFTLGAGNVDGQYETTNSKTVAEYIVKNFDKFTEQQESSQGE